jgi:hypothetical protein
LVFVANIILGSANPTEAQVWAADYNGNGTINVMDIVDMVNNICGASPSSAHGPIPSAQGEIDRRLDLSDRWTIPVSTRYVGEVAGMQLAVTYDPQGLIPVGIILTDRCQDMEVKWTDHQGRMTMLLFSEEGKVIRAGIGPLFSIAGATRVGRISESAFQIENAILVSPEGKVIDADVIVQSDQARTEVPHSSTLQQNWPNPFNMETDIRYQIAEDGYPSHTTLKIFNILGEEVRTLVDEVEGPGIYSVKWDGCDVRGQTCSSGMYFYRLSAGGSILTLTMTLIK